MAGSLFAGCWKPATARPIGPCSTSQFSGGSNCDSSEGKVDRPRGKLPPQAEPLDNRDSSVRSRITAIHSYLMTIRSHGTAIRSRDNALSLLISDRKSPVRLLQFSNSAEMPRVPNTLILQRNMDFASNLIAPHRAKYPQVPVFIASRQRPVRTRKEPQPFISLIILDIPRGRSLA